MGLETATLLAIGTFALASAGTFVAISQQAKSAKHNAEAAATAAQMRDEELSRQQKQINEAAQEKKSDTVRHAEQMLGALNVANAENGLSTSTFDRMIAEIGYAEGIDLSRVERNRNDSITALQAQKRAGSFSAGSSIEAEALKMQNAGLGGALSVVGSGLQIGSSAYYRQERLDAAERVGNARIEASKGYR